MNSLSLNLLNLKFGPNASTGFSLHHSKSKQLRLHSNLYHLAGNIFHANYCSLVGKKVPLAWVTFASSFD